MKVRVIFIIFFILCLSSFCYQEYQKWLMFNDGKLHLYFLNVGQGDSFFIKTPNNKIIFIDGGADESVLFRFGKAVPFWITKIDYLVISHLHRDHYLGAYYLDKNFSIDKILYGNTLNVTNEINDLFSNGLAGEKNDPKYLFVKNKYNLALDPSVEVQVYNFNSGNKLVNENYGSLIVSVKYNEFEAVFTGDAPPSIQKAAQGVLSESDILKVPHQGSKYDLYIPFIEAINPEVAIISVGKNTYGHPHKEVVDYYETRPGLQLLRTDSVENYIVITSDGFGYTVLSQ